MLINAMGDKQLPVYGDGSNIRDWLYVEDHCRAIDLILQSKTTGPIYNVGGINETSNIDIVKMILEFAGKDESLIKYVEDRPGHDLRYAIDPTKITRELGWTPHYDVKTGINKTLEWYVNNQEWWGKLLSKV